MSIRTSREDYFRELSRLGVKTRRRRELRSEYYRTLALIRWYPERREELLARAREIREAITVLDEDIAYERELIAKKVIVPPPPPPREELIGDEECSGYDIWFNLDTRKYVVRHPETKAFIREEEKICMELTASIETHTGHEVPLIVEMTATTLVKDMSLSELVRAEKQVEGRLMEWLIEQGWGNVIHAFTKTAVAYNGQKHIEETKWYAWRVPDYPKVYVYVEKREPRVGTYEGEFTV